MFKKTAFAVTLLSLSLTALASNWHIGGGFSQLSESTDSDSTSLNIIYGSVAYKIESSEKNYFFMPELRLGTGIADDSINGFTFKVERFLALSLRGQYDFSNGAYVYFMPAYANVYTKASSNSVSMSDNSWEFGLGGGVGYQLNKKVSVEASFENYHDIDLLSVGFTYNF